MKREVDVYVTYLLVHNSAVTSLVIYQTLQRWLLLLLVSETGFSRRSDTHTLPSFIDEYSDTHYQTPFLTYWTLQFKPDARSKDRGRLIYSPQWLLTPCDITTFSSCVGHDFQGFSLNLPISRSTLGYWACMCEYCSYVPLCETTFRTVGLLAKKLQRCKSED